VSGLKSWQQYQFNMAQYIPTLTRFIWLRVNVLPVFPIAPALQHSRHLQYRNPISNNAVRHLDSQAPQWHQGSALDTCQSMAKNIAYKRAEHEYRILESLAFSFMRDHENAISKPATGTFDWVFLDSTANGMSWSNFSKWLAVETSPRESSSRIYWINGTAGSGKSTLMKHLFYHRETRIALARWANQSKWCLGRFFFSHNGQDLQRSREGLLRTFLYTCLKNHRELIPWVVPYYNRFDRDENRNYWSLDRLQIAFQRLVSQNLVALKFCFFVDGLDECAGNYSEVTSMLITAANYSHVKICFSSRSLQAFERSLSGFPGLVLQYFTGTDIQQFVRSILSYNNYALQLERQSPGWIDSVVMYIASKASGVFLWVKLVMRILLEGLRNRDGVSDLQRRVNDLPETLEQLYWHMIRRVTPQGYLREGFRLLLLVKATGGSADVLALAFAEMETYPPTTHGPLSMVPDRSEQEQQCRILIERTTICCAGLLETSSSTGEVMATRVKFSHNSVSDFLETENVRNEILRCSNGINFIPEVQNLHGILWRLKTYHTRQWKRANLERNEFFVHVCSLVNHFIYMAWRAESATRYSQTEIVDELDRVASSLWATVASKSRLEQLGLIHWTVAPSNAGAIYQTAFPDAQLSWISAIGSIRRTKRINPNILTTNDTMRPGHVGNEVDMRAFAYYAKERGLHLYAAAKCLPSN
jgi:hypothetical protein